VQKCSFFLGIANKISMSHLVSLTLIHTHACKGINASRNWHTFYFLVYKPVGCASGFGLLLTSCRVVIKNVTVYIYVFIFALGSLYRLFILKALATIQIHLKCSSLYSLLLSHNTYLEFSLNSFTKCHFHMQCI